MPMLTVMLAQLANWQRLGDGIHKPGTRGDLADLLPLGLALLAVGLIVAGLNYWRKRSDYTLHCDDGQKLFRELCDAHKLDLRSKRLLHRLSVAAGLQEPAEVFVSPEAFDPDRLPERLAGEEERLRALRDRLF